MPSMVIHRAVDDRPRWFVYGSRKFDVLPAKHGGWLVAYNGETVAGPFPTTERLRAGFPEHWGYLERRISGSDLEAQTLSRRLGITSRVDFEADGGVSPNAYKPAITVEVRVFWPPRATEAQLMDAIHEGTDQAIADVLAHGEFIHTINVVPGSGLGVDDSAPITQTSDHIV